MAVPGMRQVVRPRCSQKKFHRADMLVYSKYNGQIASGQREVQRYRFFGVRMYETEMVRLTGARLAMHTVVYQHLGQVTKISERPG